jgi:chitobiase/beta-hexosaminidase-like protein/NHL repeat-containing protein
LVLAFILQDTPSSKKFKLRHYRGRITASREELFGIHFPAKGAVMFRKILSFFSFRARTGVPRFSCGTILAFAVGLPVAVLPLSAAAQTNFGEVNIGSSTTAAASVTMTNAATLGSIAVVTQGATNLDFTNASGGTCAVGTNYAADATCTVNVTFAPKYAGARYGAVVLADANGAVIATAYLQGTGQGPQTTFVSDGVQSTVASFSPELGIFWSSGVAVDGNGNVYITNYDRFGDGQAQLFKETLSGDSYIQSVVPTSTMGGPYGVALDGAGNIYVTDTDNFRVLKETPSAGSYSESIVASFAHIDGSAPIGVAVDGSGNVFISLGSDTGTVYEETPTATGYIQSTVVSDLPAAAGVAVDGAGNVYAVVNEINGWIVKETPAAGGFTQSTIPIGGKDGGVPFGIAVDESGNVYISFIESNDNGQVFKETATGDGYTQSTIPTSGLNQPYGVTVDGSGNVYIADSYNSRALKEDLADPPSLSFATTPLGLTSSDSPQTVVVSNIGNAELKFSALSYPADFPEASGIASDCTASTQLAGGATCTLTIDFTPDEPLNGKTSELLTESVALTTNTLNTAATQQAVAVAGTETQPVAAAATPTFLPAAGVYTSVQSVAISDTTPGAAIYYTTDGTAPTTSSTQYIGAITVSQTETIQAIAAATGYANSVVASATYTINLPPADFSVAVSPSSLSISSGQPGKTTVSVTPLNGFASAVSFSCSGLPSGASCSFNPTSVTPSGSTASTTLTVSTTSAASSAARHNSRPLFPGATLAVALCCLGWRKRRRVHLLLAMYVFGLVLLIGCGSRGSSQPVTSTVTVIATAGSLQHNATFSLTVQ